jgi:hypothetical protein
MAKGGKGHVWQPQRAVRRFNCHDMAADAGQVTASFFTWHILGCGQPRAWSPPGLCGPGAQLGWQNGAASAWGAAATSHAAIRKWRGKPFPSWWTDLHMYMWTWWALCRHPVKGIRT